MRLKHIAILSCTFALLSGPAAKAENPSAKAAKTSTRTEELKPARQKLISSDRNIFRAGVLIGTDIGGAIPVPFKYIPSTFNPYPASSPNSASKTAGASGPTSSTRPWE